MRVDFWKGNSLVDADAYSRLEAVEVKVGAVHHEKTVGVCRMWGPISASIFHLADGRVGDLGS